VEVTESIRCVYYSFQSPAFPVSNRDFCVVAGERLTEDGIFVSAVNSIERDDVPEESGFVRGVLSPSGFVITPLPNAEDGSPRCEVVYLVQLDPMGWVPHWITNMVNVDQPRCINQIKDAIDLTETMMSQAFTSLFELTDEEWTSDTLKKICTKAIDDHNGKTEMLMDPVKYVITGNRAFDGDVFEEMEKAGKATVMKKVWDAFLPYCQSIASEKLYELADACDFLH